MLLDLIVIGLAIALDPISLTPFLLILASKRGVQKGAAFMFGWLTSMAIVIAATLLVTQSNPPAPNSAPSTAALVVKLLIGLVLIYFAVRQRRKMGQPKPPKKTPKWQTGIDNMSLWFAALLAPLTQPWGMIAAGVTVITQADLASAQDVVALILFVLIATSIIITLELFAHFRPERAQASIRRIRSAIAAHSDQVIVVLFLALGLYLVASSIYYLSTS
jgi:threonine/homoserine/homoserine lactone efflux protein